MRKQVAVFYHRFDRNGILTLAFCIISSTILLSQASTTEPPRPSACLAQVGDTQAADLPQLFFLYI